MVKVTLNDNLVAYRQMPSATYIDLTEDIYLARTLVKGATQFFHLARNRARFSGYLDRSPGEVRFELWYRGKLYRIVRFPDVEYSALLRIDIPVGTLRHAVNVDILGDLYGLGCFAQLQGLEMAIEGHRLIPA